MPGSNTNEKPCARVPRHVAIVMDGNGRWAKKRMLPRLVGHQKGVESVRRVLQGAAKAGVCHLSLFAFSSENWYRPKEEVQGLMKLFLSSLRKEIESLHKSGVRIRFIGDLSAFSAELRREIDEAERKTENNKAITLNLCINYGGRWEILEAARKIRDSGAEFTQEQLSANLPMAESGDVDLFIRTSGEIRISNFMLWQLAYSELYFTDILWPDFGEKEFSDALAWYAGRERRFGQTSEQIKESSRKE